MEQEVVLYPYLDAVPPSGKFSIAERILDNDVPLKRSRAIIEGTVLPVVQFAHQIAKKEFKAIS